MPVYTPVSLVKIVAGLKVYIPHSPQSKPHNRTLNKSFICTGQLIAMMSIRAVKVPSIAVTRLPL